MSFQLYYIIIIKGRPISLILSIFRDFIISPVFIQQSKNTNSCKYIATILPVTPFFTARVRNKYYFFSEKQENDLLRLCFYGKINIAVKLNLDVERWLSWPKAHDWKSCER